MDTGLIERNLEDLTRTAEMPEQALLFAALAAYEIDTDANHAGFRLWGEASHRVVLQFSGEALERRIVLDGQGGVMLVGGHAEVRFIVSSPRWGDEKASGVSNVSLPSGLLKTDFGNVPISASVAVSLHGATKHISVLFNGETFAFERFDPLAGDNAAHQHSGAITAPMTGVVRLVAVKSGDTVKAGDRLLVMEAMKMEHTLTSPRDGVIDQVFCREGGQAEGGAVLVRLKEDAA
jgi:3-methylcrotonyl-CoA carboxylase alpha subunit